MNKYVVDQPYFNSMVLGLPSGEFQVKVCYLRGRPDGRNSLDGHGKSIYLDMVADGRGSRIKTIIALVRLFRRERPQIVHCHRHKSTVYGVVASRLAGVPCVISHTHGTRKERLRKPKKRIVNMFVYRWVDRIITVSKQEREDVLEANWSLDPAKVVTVWNGIDMDIFNIYPSGKDKIKQKMGVSPGELVFGTVGRLSWKKAHSCLLVAFAEVVKEVPDSRLVIVGDGPLFGELLSKAQGLDVSSKVFFLGYRPDVHELLSGFDIFVFPSLSEGLPLSLLEAMASKLPVVISDARGMPEIFGQGGFGRMFPAGDARALARAMIEVGSLTYENRREMGEAARKRVESSFTSEAMCKALADVYKSVLMQSNR